MLARVLLVLTLLTGWSLLLLSYSTLDTHSITPERWRWKWRTQPQPPPVKQAEPEGQWEGDPLDESSPTWGCELDDYHEPRQPPVDDGRYYVTTDTLPGGYNNQWNELSYLLSLGAELNRTVVLPPAIQWIVHMDYKQTWESIYQFKHLNTIRQQQQQRQQQRQRTSHTSNQHQRSNTDSNSHIHKRSSSLHSGMSGSSCPFPLLGSDGVLSSRPLPLFGFQGVVPWSAGVSACGCGFVSVSRESALRGSYSPLLHAGSQAGRGPKCIHVTHPQDGFTPGTLAHPPPTNILQQQQIEHYYYCTKPMWLLASLPLVGWLDSLLCGVVGLLSHDFVGVHLRLGDFSSICWAQDQGQQHKRLWERPDVCPLTHEIINTVQRYCLQACALHYQQQEQEQEQEQEQAQTSHTRTNHGSTQHLYERNNSTLRKPCTLQQQRAYTCKVVIASNPKHVHRLAQALHNATQAYQQQQPQQQQAKGTQTSKSDPFIMTVRFLHVPGLLAALRGLSGSSSSPGSDSSSGVNVEDLDLGVGFDLSAGFRLRPRSRASSPWAGLWFSGSPSGGGSDLSAMELSVLEQYVMSRATIFIGNTHSTWSKFVYQLRVSSGLLNGWMYFHRWLSCREWTMTATDQQTMQQAPDTNATLLRPRTPHGTQDEPFNL